MLVVGYGNELRGDDAFGPQVASRIEALALPGIRVLTQPQLTPELSEALAEARAVVFIDATTSGPGSEVEVTRLQATAPGLPETHLSDPRALLALARTLFGKCPPAWLVTVPAQHFDVGAPLSPSVRRGVATAVTRVQELIHSA